MTGESVFGELKGGTLVNVSCNLAARLFDPTCVVLASFGSAVPFEIAVGVNGIVWVRASSCEFFGGPGCCVSLSNLPPHPTSSNAAMHTAAINSAILRSEGLNDEKCRLLVREIIDALQRNQALATGTE